MQNGKAGEVSRIETSPSSTTFRVRTPKIRDARNFATAIATADLRPETADLASGGANEAAMMMMLKDAMASPLAMEQLLMVVADLWEYEPDEAAVTADEPPEEWEYDPPADVVESGNAIGRDERWRSLSKRQKRRLIKRLDLEDLGVDAIPAFWEAMKDLPYLKDFLASSGNAGPEDTGSSSTPSATATAGPTKGRKKRSVAAQAE